MFKNFSNWKTTIMGFLVVIIPVIIVIGWVTADEGDVLIEQTGIFFEAVEAIIGVVGAFILVFKAKDG